RFRPWGESAASPSDKQTGTAQYLSANCVLYTSYIGDPGRVVDEHFSRALGSSEKSK
ncbi:Protein vestigiallike, partial [Caligus rogercresseyi]